MRVLVGGEQLLECERLEEEEGVWLGVQVEVLVRGAVREGLKVRGTESDEVAVEV